MNRKKRNKVEKTDIRHKKLLNPNFIFANNYLDKSNISVVFSQPWESAILFQQLGGQNKKAENH